MFYKKQEEINLFLPEHFAPFFILIGYQKQRFK